MKQIQERRSIPRPKLPEPIVVETQVRLKERRQEEPARSKADIRRELQEAEERQARKVAERELRRRGRAGIPEHSEGVPRVGWATDEDVRRIRRKYGR
jgi:hypothetical protein